MSFGLKILSVEPGNTVISPINIAHAFSILLAGTDTSTRGQIISLLSPLSPEKIISNISGISDEIKIAARLFLGAKFEIKSEFHSANQKAFGNAPQGESVDFSKPSEAAEKINAWVKKVGIF